MCRLFTGEVESDRGEGGVPHHLAWRASAVRDADGHAEIRAPKYNSERTVHAPDGLLAVLAEHIRPFRSGDDPDRWLFPGTREEGMPIHVGMVGRGWEAAREAVGINYRLHDLRHFYASGLIRAGCDVVTVQRALGHSSATTTLATYSHLWPDANDRTRRAAAELVDAALGTVADGSADAPADALRTQ